jgi:hypothetical protein
MGKPRSKRLRPTNTFRSKFELGFSTKLLEHNIQFEYESLKLKYTIPERSGVYTPDFIIPGVGGKPILIETKGYWSAEDRTKLKLVKESNPGIDLRIVFMNARNKIHKASKTTYGDWATKIGIPWADKTIPLEWVNEIKGVP